MNLAVVRGVFGIALLACIRGGRIVEIP